MMMGKERLRCNRWVVVKIMVPFLGTLNNRCRIIIGIQKRDHDFEPISDAFWMLAMGP